MTVKRRVGLYPGTFDPITLGHNDIITRAAQLVDHLIIGVARNPGKNPMFSVGERVDMVKETAADIDGQNVEVRSFSNLLMHFAMECNADVIIRGLRAVSDFEYEFQMAGMNSRLNRKIQTIFLMASDQHQFIASSLVKEIGILGGDISEFLSPRVAERVRQRVEERKKNEG